MLFDRLKRQIADPHLGQPFSFVYNGRPSGQLLSVWGSDYHVTALDEHRTRVTATWADPKTHLRVEWSVIRYEDFPAVEWMLHFENTGDSDTAIVENIAAMDVTFASEGPYLLHRTKGAPSDSTDFEPGVAALDGLHPVTMGGGAGRSSNKDFPFFKLQAGSTSVIATIGWSGQWIARFEYPDEQDLQITAGMESTHFLLHPGERVRSPRILLMFWDGDTLECNAQFRQLIHKHYAARWNGRRPLPILFCNTAFTRGGNWLNECDAENQISLINAYGHLGVEALVTDAGWFVGGWPNGVGTWKPRHDAYPDGMAPVAQAALEHDMLYGLWFEPERVMSGTWIHEFHPEWLLASPNGEPDTHLLNMGLSAVQEYLFRLVEDYMDLPGFGFYRQDFNMDPLPYWRDNERPDRRGITEIKYIEGLYAFWDRLAATWPEGIREECAAGGRRIDLETVMRMHLHQESDYWFDNEVDQARVWSLSRYLPNSCFDTPLTRLDDYSFFSTMGTSLIPAWIADDPDFDGVRAGQLLGLYRSVRHLLVGAWYPLTPYSMSKGDWMAMQFHRPDLAQGMVLAFRREECAQQSLDVALRGLDPAARYGLIFHSTGALGEVTGEELMNGLRVTLPDAPAAEMMVYRRIEEPEEPQITDAGS